MTIDDQIRAALREDAGEAAPPADGWDDVVGRAAVHARRRRAIRYPIVGVAAAAAIAAIIAGAVALRTTSESEPPRIATPSGGAMPEEIAAIVNDRLVVLESETGAEVRTIAEGATGTISADDRYVYFTRTDDRDCDPPTYEIVRVPIGGGAAEPVARGVLPHVSPNGRWLAYNSNGFASPPGNLSSPARCSESSQLVVRDLKTGDERRFFVPGADADPPRATFYALGWSADSTRLLYEIYTGGDEEEGRWLLDAEAESGALDDSNSTSVEVPADTANVFGVAPDGSLLLSRATAGRNEIVLSNPETGEVKESIVEVGDRTVRKAVIDLSGRHVLFHASATSWNVPLERVSIGGTPVTVSTRALGAVWLPHRTASPPTSTTPTTTPETTPTTTPAGPSIGPETIVAVDADGRLIVMASDDSTRRSELLAPPTDGSQYESVSVGPGNAIAVARVTPSDNYCSTFETGQIELVNRETSRTETLGNGRYPALSPDGKRLAWVGVDDCVTGLRVRDLESGTESVLTAPPSTDGGPDPQLSGPITWAPDSRHLMVPMNVEPLVDWWYVDADTPDGMLAGPVIEQRGEQGGPFAMTPVSSSEVVAVVADPDGSNLRLTTLALPSGEEHGQSIVFEGDPATIELQSDSTGRHLLLIQVVDGEPTLYSLIDRGLAVTPGTGQPVPGIRSADW